MSDDPFHFRPVPFFAAPRAPKPEEPANTQELAPKPPPEPAKAHEPAPKRASRRPPVVRSLAYLTPSFRLDIGEVLADLHTQGYSPRVWETLRTEARGAWLQRNGKSKNGARSMHVYGVAVDIICAEHSWRCPGTCGFFPALGAAAKARGLTWGGDWGWDSPHVQAIAVADQQAIRDSADIETTLRELG